METPPRNLRGGVNSRLPPIVTRAGERASRRFIEFFTANIRNRNTRAAYARAVGQFLCWCEKRELELAALSPIVAAYVEGLRPKKSDPTIKQHLAAMRMSRRIPRRASAGPGTS